MNRTLFSERRDVEQVELGRELAPKFDDRGLIPCITTDAESGEVLMFAWMNRDSISRTLKSGKATYFSRSRNRIWVKGESSGRSQHLVEMLVDCDQDAILLKVRMEKQGACHRGYRSCFYRKVSDQDPAVLEFVEEQPIFDPEKVYRK